MSFFLTKYLFKDLVTKFYVVFWAFIPCCRCGKISQKELRKRLIGCRRDAEEGQVQTCLSLSLCLFLFFGCQFSICRIVTVTCLDTQLYINESSQHDIQNIQITMYNNEMMFSWNSSLFISYFQLFQEMLS